MPRSRFPLLTQQQLNRATLARQFLLEPARLSPVDAIERVGGLQAQEPASPYLALWARLAAFDPASLDAAFHDREVVKATLMRVTVHAVSRRDYISLLPAVLPMLRRLRRNGAATILPADLESLSAIGADFAAVPRSNVELRDHVNRFAALPGDDVWWRVRRHAPFLHVPATVPWAFARRPTLVAAEAWLDEPFASESYGLRHLVERYLRAFGPASAADMAAWSGLTVAALQPTIAALDTEGLLQRFSDEAGRELLDIVGAPLPPADTPAPPRLLPMWDSVLLAHADRTRVLPLEYRSRVIARNGDVLPTFLVDGCVAGLWWAEHDGSHTRFVVEPFAPLTSSVRAALESLGDDLARFVEPLEPAVYARYRWDRTRTSGR